MSSPGFGQKRIRLMGEYRIFLCVLCNLRVESGSN
jgi:hypothetical protein